MGVVVQFDYPLFQQQWPAYAQIGQVLAQNFWDLATTLHANDGSGPVGNSTLQAKLLNALTAHLAQLYAPRDSAGNPAATGAPAPALVGRITSASEGSVSVSTEALQGFTTAQAAWLSQTQPGSFYWVATTQFRTMRMVGAPSRSGYGLYPLTFR